MSRTLSALLQPKSLAILGASTKAGSAGRAIVRAACADGFAGAIFPVNPRYQKIEGLSCYPNLGDLPKVPDHVILGVGNAHLPDAMDAVARAGIKAATIFASGDDAHVRETLRTKADAAGIALCGPNCMGLLRPEIGLRIAAYEARGKIRKGGIVWLAQSGSAFSALTFNQPRLGFKLAVSTGAELTTDFAEYMHWALDQDGTRVIGLFLEGVRHPARFAAALEKARNRGIPVVVLKVGRTARSAAMAATHTGALAGNDGAFKALWRRYNVIEVHDLDEMTATLALLDQPKRFVSGGLATMHDSGGERELLVDLADETGTRLADISNATKAAIAPHLDNGVPADNPLDAWGTARDYEARFTACADALLADPAVASLGFFSDPRDGHEYHEGLVDAVLTAAGKTEKPVFLATNTLLADDLALAERALQRGVPLIKGTRAALTAIARINAHAGCTPDNEPDLPAPHIRHGTLAEADGLRLLEEAGLTVPRTARIDSEKSLERAAQDIPPPYVLKTDEGHAHKSDLGGVVVGLPDTDALRRAYAGISNRLGRKALVMQMAPKGVEIGLGAFADPGFGPVVAVSAGGVLIEVFKDVQFALAPFGPKTARQMVQALSITPLLHPHRGQSGADMDALCAAIARFSTLIASHRECLIEADVNPLIVSPGGAVAVDALFLFKDS